jgi:hypothetical protein
LLEIAYFLLNRSDPDVPRWCDWCRYCASATSPDEHLPVPIRSQFLDLDELNLEVFKIVVTEVKRRWSAQ